MRLSQTLTVLSSLGGFSSPAETMRSPEGLKVSRSIESWIRIGAEPATTSPLAKSHWFNHRSLLPLATKRISPTIRRVPSGLRATGPLAGRGKSSWRARRSFRSHNFRRMPGQPRFSPGASLWTAIRWPSALASRKGV